MDAGEKCACGCGRTIEQPATGRPRRYALDSCRKRAQRDRDWRRRYDMSSDAGVSQNPGKRLSGARA